MSIKTFWQKKYSFFCAAFILAFSLAATLHAAAPLTAEQKAYFGHEVMAEIQRGPYQRAQWGFQAIDAASGDVVFAYNETQAVMTASNRKLFSSAFALDALGPDFRFTTTIEKCGPLDANGVLQGDLIVRAAGDPTMSHSFHPGGDGTEVLDDLAGQVRAAGIQTVSGDLLIDLSCFRDEEFRGEGWETDYETATYAALPCAFSVNENAVEVSVSPGSPGGACHISCSPASEFLTVKNETETTSKGGNSISMRHDSDGALVVSGSLSRRSGGESDEVAVAAPAKFAAGVMKNCLAHKGVRVLGATRLSTRRIQPSQPTTAIAVCSSPPLRDVLPAINQKSNNFVAEMVYLAAGRAGTYQPACYELSRSRERTFWQRCGLIDAPSLYSADGCGLSRLNRFTPRAFCQLLSAMLRHPQRDVYIRSLSVNGVVGTLKGRLGDSPYRERIHGKTGFINSVSCLSGYLVDMENRTLIFSILVNDFSCSTDSVKGAEDRICRDLIDLPRQQPAALTAMK